MKPKPRYQPGDRIGGRYQVHQALMGGMGEVYLCLDLKENYPYALKTFQQRYLTSPRVRELFEEEVATWVALEKHPNIVRCYYMDTLDDQPFMILEWVASDESQGTDLRSWLRHGALDLRLALDFAIDIGRGLIHASEKRPGIVHRDLKPDNVLVAQGRLAKVTDFGLAQVVRKSELEVAADAEREPGGRQSLVGQGGIAGTPPYMAPEQWRDDALDARADIYAIGCILYEMLTGTWPFQAATLDGLRRQHLEADIPSLEAHQRLPGALDTLLARCLAKRCEDRFASAGELLEQLTLLYQQEFAEPPKAAPPGSEFTAIDYNNRGATYADLQLYDEALADYEQTIRLDPEFAQVYSNRGATYHKSRHYEEALSDYERALQLDPTLAPVYNNRGATSYELQRHEEALTAYSSAIRLDPANATAYDVRGSILKELQRHDEALADYERAIQLDPTLASAHRSRAGHSTRPHGCQSLS
jgi:serine/threonine protein kinase